MITLGIDPGITGAISIFNDGHFRCVHDMPVMQMGKTRQINSAALAGIVIDESKLKSDSPNDVVAYLEKVNAMPGQGVTSMFNFGMGYGAIQGVLAAHHIPYKLVTPQKWKKYYNLTGKDKDCARTLAIQQFPKAELNLKKHIGRADAILIGQYGVKSE